MAEHQGRLQEALATRRSNYSQVFRGVASEIVLADLARFCRAHESTAHPDPYAAARLDGRREVWLRIQQHLNLSPDQLWALYTGRAMNTENTDG